MILAFVGAISKEEAIKIVSERFSAMPDKTPSNNSGISNSGDLKKEFTNKNVYIADKPGAVQSNLRIGHIGIARNNPDYIAVSVLNTILGGYFGSRINYNLREKHGFTYGARSGFTVRLQPGDFSVDTDVRNEVTDSPLR